MISSKPRKSVLGLERLEARELMANSFLQGLAYHDLNGNGVLDVNEPRQAGATVRVFRGAEQNPLQTVTTGNDGYYRFNNLAPGNYRLEQTAPNNFFASGAQAQSQINPATVVANNRIDVTLVDPAGLEVGTYFPLDNGVFERIPVNGVRLFGRVPPGFQEEGGGDVGSLRVQVARPGLPLFDMFTFCAELDISDFFPSGQFTPEPYSGPIGYLYSRYGATRNLGSSTQYAGLQMAIWELLYDPGSPNLTAGNFQYVGQHPERAAIVTAANNFLAEAAGKSEPVLFLRTRDPIFQSFLGTGTFNFGNRPAASLEGFKWHDLNANGLWENNEPGLSGWTIQVLQNNTVLGTTTTAADGRYRFANLVPGTYQIREVVQPNWIQSYPTGSGTHTVTLGLGQNFVSPQFSAVPANFGNFQQGRISGQVNFQSPECTELRDRGPQGGVRIVLERQVNGQFQFVTEMTTGGNGSYNFDNLNPGTYRVRQVVGGWIEVSRPAATFVLSSGQTLTNLNFVNRFPLDVNARCGTLSGQVTFREPTCDGLVERGGRSGVTVYIDANRNGTLDDSEPRTVTDTNGNYRFGPLGSGSYPVRIVTPAGLRIVGPDLAETNQSSPLFDVTGLNFKLEVVPTPPLICVPRTADAGRDLLPVFPGVSPPVLTSDLGGKLQLLGSTIEQEGRTGGVLAQAAFVTGVYRGLLNRAPDNGGLVTFVQMLQGGVSRAQVVNAIYGSGEHRGIQVDFYYTTYLGRRADPGGKAFWANALASGLSEKDFLAQLLGSAEFHARSNSDNGMYVARLYSTILNRQAETSGFAAFTQALQTGTSRVAVALAILNSREASKRTVDLIYSNLLDRQLDPVGEQAWLTALGRGQVSWADVTRAVLASDEYFARLHALARAGR